MTESEFIELGLVIGQSIMIHTVSGSTWDGSYLGNFDNSNLEFDFENHNNGKSERIRLEDIHSVLKK